MVGGVLGEDLGDRGVIKERGRVLRGRGLELIAEASEGGGGGASGTYGNEGVAVRYGINENGGVAVINGNMGGVSRRIFWGREISILDTWLVVRASG